MTALLLDLDGVVYGKDGVIPGAAQTVGWLRDMGVPYLFLTNTTSLPRSALVTRLGEMGIATNPAQIFTPPVAAVVWLSAHVSGPLALFVPKATRAEFAQLPVLEEREEKGAGAVVVGDLGSEWNFAVLNRAFRLLMADPDCLLVALGMTRYWRAPDGMRLDVAPFVTALQHATGRAIHVLGKPAAAFFEAALARVGSSPEDTVMVGDDIRGDVGGAQASGLRGVLVRTGKFRLEDLSSEITPDGVIDSIAQLPAWWQRNVLDRG